MNLEEKVKEIQEQIEDAEAAKAVAKSEIAKQSDRVKLLTKTLKSYQKLITQAKDLEDEAVGD